MSGAQRLIKYCAIAFAVFLMFMIGSGILMGVSALGFLIQDGRWYWDSDESNMELIEGITDSQDVRVRALDVNVKATAVRIRTVQSTENVRVETDNEYIDAWVADGELHIVERSHGFFGWGGTGRLIIYVREGTVFDEVKIEAGAGELSIDELATGKLNLNLGAGRVAIDRLLVSERANIEGGAGSIEILEGDVTGLDMELGAGRMSAYLRLNGVNKIDSGVGKLELKLAGGENDYYMTLDKGIGSVTLNGLSLDDGETWGRGSTKLEIDSGVGAVEIRTTE